MRSKHALNQDAVPGTAGGDGLWVVELARAAGFNLAVIAGGEAVRAAMHGAGRDDERDDGQDHEQDHERADVVACAVVLATGGRAFFERFQAAMQGDAGLAAEEHPLDVYTERVTLALCEEVEARLMARGRVVFAHGESRLVGRGEVAATRMSGGRVDFQSLGVACGVGQRSALGILLHPDYGPWVSLRAALLLPVALSPLAVPIAGRVACETCARPCVDACPVAAPMHPPGQPGFAFEACFARVALTTGCDAMCHARAACPVGAEHRYGAGQHAFHHGSFVKMVRALCR